ncbi:MAG: hypothetical protein KJN72_07080 [Woeseia sp.]|nr:hypothetical protein [Woeseia sp.]
MAKYKCNNCGNLTDTARTRGNGWIEIILYLFVFIIGGVIYSIWRRSGGPGICPTCKKDNLIPASATSASNASAPNIEPSTVKCKWCAETIQAKARICRFCQKPVTPKFVEDSKANKQIAAIDTLHSKGHSSEKIAAFLKSKNQVYPADNSEWTAEKVDHVIQKFIENSQPAQNQEGSHSQKAKRTLKQNALRGLSWGFGGILFLMGLILLIPAGVKSSASLAPWIALILIVIASLLLPPIRKYVYSKTKFELPIKARAIVIASLCLILGAMSGYQHYEKNKAQELAAKQAKEVAERIEKVKQDKIDNFNENREQIISSIRYAFNAKNYQAVLNLANEHSLSGDRELEEWNARAKVAQKLVKEKMETNRILAKLKTVPASGYVTNRNLYQQLVNYNPNNEGYRKKLSYYTKKVDEQVAKSSKSVSTSNNDNYKLCKEAAAHKWLLDFSMANNPHTQAQQLEAIKQVSILAKAIKKFCGDNSINNEVRQSANLGRKPAWIKAEIDVLVNEAVKRIQ